MLNLVVIMDMMAIMMVQHCTSNITCLTAQEDSVLPAIDWNHANHTRIEMLPIQITSFKF